MGQKALYAIAWFALTVAIGYTLVIAFSGLGRLTGLQTTGVFLLAGVVVLVWLRRISRGGRRRSRFD